ncbi:MAG: hypothetical protein QOK48_1815 [Blastocatellia bacterium]|jgi:hypothetical protein|nr:hypothetical protein [Blastocatellia bacterium]
MFVATIARAKISLRQERNLSRATMESRQRRLRSYGASEKKRPPGYKHLAPLGRSSKQRCTSNLNSRMTNVS